MVSALRPWGRHRAGIRFIGMPIEILALVTLAMLLAIVLFKRRALPTFKLVAPTGPYPIGTTTRQLVNPAKPNPLAPAGHAPQVEATVQVWYPRQPDTTGALAPYLSHGDGVIEGIRRLYAQERGRPIPHWMFTWAGITAAESHAIVKAPPITRAEAWPVLVVLSGYGGHRNVHMGQIETLTANGFVVIGIDLPYVSAHVRSSQTGEDRYVRPRAEILDPIGKDALINILTEQLYWVLTELPSLGAREDAGILAALPLGKIGVYGVSLGAISGGLLARISPMVTAVAMADAHMHADVAAHGIGKPALWFTRTADEMRAERKRSGGWSEPDIADTIDSTNQAMVNQPEGMATEVHIPGLFHAQFTDTPLWFGRGVRKSLEGTTPTIQAHEQINQHLVQFFTAHLAP